MRASSAHNNTDLRPSLLQNLLASELLSKEDAADIARLLAEYSTGNNQDHLAEQIDEVLDNFKENLIKTLLDRWPNLLLETKQALSAFLCRTKRDIIFFIELYPKNVRTVCETFVTLLIEFVRERVNNFNLNVSAWLKKASLNEIVFAAYSKDYCFELYVTGNVNSLLVLLRARLEQLKIPDVESEIDILEDAIHNDFAWTYRLHGILELADCELIFHFTQSHDSVIQYITNKFSGLSDDDSVFLQGIMRNNAKNKEVLFNIGSFSLEELQLEFIKQSNLNRLKEEVPLEQLEEKSTPEERESHRQNMKSFWEQATFVLFPAAPNKENEKTVFISTAVAAQPALKPLTDSNRPK